MSIWNPQFWRATGERVLSTALQAAVPTITAASLQGINWGAAASITGAAALLSLVKNVISGLQNGSPGIGSAELLATEPAVIEPYVGERSPDFPDSKDVDDTL